MKKDAVEDKADNKAGEPVNTEEVFKNDANVLEYLNSLLSSVPAVVLESGETQFVRLAIDEGWKGLDAATALINNAVSYHNELSRKEVELLELENRNLKLREELASIDAQVLRSENENLRDQITRLTGQLDALKAAFEELTSENDGLKAWVGYIEEQSAVSVNTKDEIDAPPVDPNIDEQGAEMNPHQQGDFVPPDPVELPDNGIVEDSRVDLAGSAVAAQESVPVIEPCVIFEPELVSVARPDSGNAGSDARGFPDTLVLSRSRDLSGAATWGVKSSSRIIKQQTADSAAFSDSHEPEPSYEKPSTPEPIVREEVYGLAPLAQNDVERGDFLEGEPVSGGADLHPREDLELDLEPVPEPREVVRRNLKNYADLQNEVDSANKRTRHRLIL